MNAMQQRTQVAQATFSSPFAFLIPLGVRVMF